MARKIMKWLAVQLLYLFYTAIPLALLGLACNYFDMYLYEH